MPILMALLLVYLPSQGQAEQSISCDQYQVNGGDEAFLMNLNTPLKWGNTVYNGNIYVSPKGTVTFGQGDYTYWDYPQTPSISIAAYDYHAFANGVMWGASNDLYVRYGSTTTSVCIDWKVMLWGQSTGEPVYIRMIAYVDPETYEWTPTYQVSNNAPSNARYGARYEFNGEVFPLEIQFISEPPSPEATVPPQPEPSEESSPSPELTTGPNPEEEGSEQTEEGQESGTETPGDTGGQEEVESPLEVPLEPSPEPSSQPSAQPITPNPDQANPRPIENQDPVKEEKEQPLQEQQEEEYKEEVVEIFSDEPSPIITEEIIISDEILVPEGQVLLANGVILDASIAESFELLENPVDMIKSLFTDPEKLFLALKNLGADMSDETREEAQKIVIVAVIVTSIITMTQIGRVK
jgi:hypothetical protein